MIDKNGPWFINVKGVATVTRILRPAVYEVVYYIVNQAKL